MENGKLVIDESTQCILPNNFCKITVTTKELIDKVFPNLTQNYRNRQKLSTGYIGSQKLLYKYNQYHHSKRSSRQHDNVPVHQHRNESRRSCQISN